MVKHGGQYRTVSGAVKNISSADRTMKMESGETIPTDKMISKGARHPAGVAIIFPPREGESI